ncbi:MAG: DEAD/DEAH box helicase [Planctomycetota bacterium]
MKFTDLELKPRILTGLKEMGYVDLTPVQEQTFPYILAGSDIIARAETGSGKTAACAVPLVQMVDKSVKAVQALILVPTRELALQYVGEISDIARRTDVTPMAVYGGFSMQIQVAKLNHGVDILVATPGRLIDLLRNTKLSLSNVRTMVLDEADEMLKMGFITDVDFIINCIVHEHQTLLFSATMPAEIDKLAQTHLREPITINLSKHQRAPQSLEHHFMQVGSKSRTEVLLEYLKQARPKQAIIFCNSRRSAERLHDHIKKKQTSTEIIHGGLDQSRRTSLFNRFRRLEIKIMVATDLASRGLDFSHATHVINYDFPADHDGYTHRTGRTARMGRKGIALTLFTKAELRSLKTVIDTNHIQPVWHGAEPDLKHTARPRQPRKHPSQNLRRPKRR